MTLPKSINIKSALKLLSVVIITLYLTAFSLQIPAASLTLEEELRKVQQDLENIRKGKINLENSIKNEKQLQNQYDQELQALKNEIDLLTNKIDEKKLVIKELELEIDILTQKLQTTRKEIEEAEGEILGLETETDARLIDMYLSQKTFSEINILVSPNGSSDFIKLNLYHNSIQDSTNDLVGSLKEKRTKLETRKIGLEEDKVRVQRDEVQLQEELVALERDEAELATKRSNFFAKKQQSIAKVESNSNQIEVLTEEEKEALAELRKLEQILFNSITKIPSGSPVKQGTIIGQQGCTGHCTGPHTHFQISYNGATVNPCSVLPAGVYGGCGVGGSSLQWPQNMPFVISGWYEYRSYGFHGAIDLANTLSNAPVYAAHDGYIIYGVDSCKPNLTAIWGCNPPGGKYAMICENRDCTIGYKSFYLHLQ